MKTSSKFPISAFALILAFQTACNTPDESYLEEHEEWKSSRLERLKASDGWLNLAGLYWLSEGKNSLGSDSVNSIVFPENAPAFCGIIFKQGDSLLFESGGSAEITNQGKIIDRLRLLPDISGTPTVCQSDSFAWFVIKRGKEYGIRLRDYNHPALGKLDSIPTYPASPRWNKRARFIAYDKPDTISVQTMIGGEEKYAVPGKLVFRHRLKKYELLPFVSGRGFFLIIGDKTSAVETYAAGRFMYTSLPDESGHLNLDFNKAYNPPCAFTPFATCPLPPPENRLKLAITAGEKSVHME